MNYEKRIVEARSISEMFAIAKEMAREYLGTEQYGFLVGVSDLGMQRNGFVSAYYLPDANTIIINKRPLAKMLRQNPVHCNNYLFHVILHEYVHSLGLYDETQARQIVGEMTAHYFGSEHAITQLTWDIGKHFTNHADEPAADLSIEFADGIDRKNADHIN